MELFFSLFLSDQFDFTIHQKQTHKQKEYHCDKHASDAPQTKTILPVLQKKK
jgi:hypothetical protein